MSTVLKKNEDAYDPKQEILAKLGDISAIQIAQNEVLVAIYVRPEINPGGKIALVPRTRKEDIYQGKVGLVLKIGAACRFVRVDEKTGITYGIDINLHDWIVTRPSDTWSLDINVGSDQFDPEKFTACRLVWDDQIRMKIPSPGIIW